MDIETARLLASAESLSDQLQMTLWRTGNRWVRYRLAARPDLRPDLQNLCVRADEYLSYWAGRHRDDESLLLVAARNATSEHSMMALAGQERAPLEALEELAGKCTRMVAWSLLNRKNMPVELRCDLVAKYVAGADYSSNGMGRQTLEVYGEEAIVWETILGNSSWAQSGLVLAAARMHKNTASIQYELTETFERMDAPGLADSPSNFDKSNSLRDVIAAGTELLRSPSLPVDILERLSAVSYLQPLHPEMHRRIAADVASLFTTLSCLASSTDCSSVEATEHARVVTMMSSFSGSEFMTTEVAMEAILHNSLLAPDVLKKALDATRGVASREIASKLEDAGRLDELAFFANQSGVLVLDRVADPLPVLLRLAAQGSGEIKDRNIKAEHMAAVVSVMRPVSRLLGEPCMLSLALERIESQPAAVAETALGLMAGWDGTIESLLDAATALVGE